MKSLSSKSLLAVSLFFSLAAVGCTSSRQAAYAPRATGTPSVARASMSDAARIEVLLDSQPQRPFAVVGDLQVRTISNTRSIAAMQERAAREGLDGIYWIDCTSTCSGACTAKGFVYLDGAATWDADEKRMMARR